MGNPYQGKVLLQYRKVLSSKRAKALIKLGFPSTEDLSNELRTLILQLTGKHPYLLPAFLEKLWEKNNAEKQEWTTPLLQEIGEKLVGERESFFVACFFQIFVYPYSSGFHIADEETSPEDVPELLGEMMEFYESLVGKEEKGSIYSFRIELFQLLLIKSFLKAW